MRFPINGDMAIKIYANFFSSQIALDFLLLAPSGIPPVVLQSHLVFTIFIHIPHTIACSAAETNVSTETRN